jgi:hypothetical protein
VNDNLTKVGRNKDKDRLGRPKGKGYKSKGKWRKIGSSL